MTVSDHRVPTSLEIEAQMPKRTELGKRLRAMAEFADSIHGLIPEEDLGTEWYGFCVWVWNSDTKPAKTRVAEIIRGIKNAMSVTKDYSSEYANVTFEFELFKLRVFTPRANVCQKVETGKMVIQKVYKTLAEEKEVPETEWVCDPILSTE